MPDSEPDNGDLVVDISEYSDYYDLLNVENGADVDTVLHRSRRLLGKYHPDVSNHPEADAIFKKVNRAQEVLTDPEQREIYALLGHEKYVERREEDGEMTLSDDIVPDNTTITDSQTRNKQDAVRNVTNDTGSGRERGLNTDTANTDDTPDDTWAGRLREHGSYQSITEFDIGLSPKESVRKMYREIWVTRITLIVSFAAAVIYLLLTDPGTIEGIWQSAGILGMYSSPALAVMTIAGFAMFITVISGIGSHKLLLPVVEDIEIESAEEQRRHERDKEQSRGLNTSVSEPGTRTSSQRDAWDAHTRFDSDNVVETNKNEQNSGSLKQGSRLLFGGILITAFGAVMNGLHPWVYLQQLMSGGGVETELWWTLGSEGIQDVAILINAGIAFVMFIFLISGVVLTTHGLSRDIWYSKYFTKQNPLPFLWDSFIILSTTVMVSGLAFGTAPIPEINTESFPSELLVFLNASNGFTTLSLSLAGALSLFILVLAFRFRKRI